MTYERKVKLISLNIFIKMFWDHEDLFNRAAEEAPTPAAIFALFRNSSDELRDMADDFEAAAVYALRVGDSKEYAYEMLWHLTCVKVFYAKNTLIA